MFIGYLTLATALILSTAAIYYSVTGLAAIFAGAVISTLIMGTILEVSKLVAVIWLHKFWSQTVWWLKTYLSIAVLMLMFITSMGIFGGLSKAHIEQTAATGENAAQIDRLTREIQRQQTVIAKSEQRIAGLESGNSGAQANIQAQIDREQARIDSAYSRIQPVVDEQNAIIESKTQLFQDQIDKIDQDLALLQSYIDSGEIRKAQGMVGTRADGDYGPATARAFTQYQTRQAQERNQLVDQLAELSADPAVAAARKEIQRVRQAVDDQVAQSNQLINRLRQRLGNNDSTSVENLVAEQTAIFQTASQELDRLTQEKFQLEAEYRKLEAEVGPIKYIADLIYGEADKNTLEEAVRWVILLIIFVFDPLAVLLLIASQYTINAYCKKPKSMPVSNTPTDDKTVPLSSVTDNRAGPSVDAEPDNSAVDRSVDQEIDTDAQEHNDHSGDSREAKHQWKRNNPDQTLKEQRRLLKQGVIDHLPWEEPAVDVIDVEFGQVWPDNPRKGYMFLRTDYVPTKLFKFNGNKWIEVDKNNSDSYVTNAAYLEFLVQKIKSGEYDPDLLSNAELDEIEKRLQSASNDN